MNLYLISQDSVRGYDTYDACVVAAPDAETARSFHPYTHQFEPYDMEDGEWSNRELRYSGVWAHAARHVEVTLIGTAAPGQLQGEILSSFHAG